MARLSAGERLMTRIRREIMGRCVVWSVPMHCPTVGGTVSCWVWTTESDSFCERNSRVLDWLGCRANSSVSEPGMVRPVDDAPLVPASDGLVLETSSTWMSVIASSVQGSGSPVDDVLFVETLVMLAYTST